MGWSCSASASNTLHKIEDVCFKETESTNVFMSEKGKRYFFETDRVEHCDGRITGEVLEFDTCKKVGTFCIKSDGTIKHFPNLKSKLKKLNERLMK